MTAPASGAAPIAAADRSPLLDALRGWALAGILASNMVGFIGFGFLPDPQRDALIGGAWNDLTEFFLEWFVVGKFYSIFSLLFGIGFAIQIGRLEASGEGVPRYVRRLVVLFAIGLLHILLLWLGDIVALYAVMGLVLLLFRRVSDRALLVWAAALWLVPVGWSAAIQFAGFSPDKPIFDHAIAMIAATGLDVSTGPLPVLQGPSILPHLLAHPGEGLIRLGDLVHQMRFAKVLGMFLIGLWVGRRAIHADPARHRALLSRVTKVGLGLGIPLAAGKAYFAMSGNDEPMREFLAELFYCLSTPTLALGYAAGFALLWAAGRTRVAGWAAPAGRMALTNYLMQTIIQSALFYGWGLGQIARFGLVYILPFTAIIFAAQVLASRWWLARFRFGPVEWVWRSLTYGRAQPMRLAA